VVEDRIMLHLAHKVTGATVLGIDGEIGTLADFFIASDPWRVGFLIVETGGAGGLQVLVPPTAVRADWDMNTVPVMLSVKEAREGAGFTTGGNGQAPSLRSLKDTTGFHLQATNGEIGHVDDFLIRQETFEIPYLLVDTSNWIGGRSVIVSTDVLDRVDQDQKLLHVEVTRDDVRRAPSLDSIDAAIHTLETGPPFTII
jgi:hypothetical protein